MNNTFTHEADRHCIKQNRKIFILSVKN